MAAVIITTIKEDVRTSSIKSLCSEEVWVNKLRTFTECSVNESVSISGHSVPSSQSL